MLMNVCLALLVVVLSFAFGIDQTESPIACRALGMSLHFFFFASLLWLGSYVVCLTRRLLPRNKDPTEEIFNPVLMYYMVSWGECCLVARGEIVDIGYIQCARDCNGKRNNQVCSLVFRCPCHYLRYDNCWRYKELQSHGIVSRSVK